METAIRIIFFSSGLIFLGIAAALENVRKFLSFDISNVPNEDLKILQMGLYGFFIAFMILTAMYAKGEV